MAIRGRSAALNRLNREVSRIRGRTLESMLKVAILARSESQRRTPVDEGNLRASHYVSSNRSEREPVVEVGCTANYAVYVHENLTARHTVGEAKFLENAVASLEGRILSIIRSGARIR